MKAYQIVAEIAGFRPRTWRRFQIAEDLTVAEMAYVLMSMFRMEGSHLFCINTSKARYKIQGDDFCDEEAANPRDITIAKAVSKEKGTKFSMEYDYGDSWVIDCAVEDIVDVTDEDAESLPKVLKGKNYGIIEDCGGIYGLGEIIYAFTVKEGEEYEEYRDWLGTDDFDFSYFSLKEVNENLKQDMIRLACYYNC